MAPRKAKQNSSNASDEAMAATTPPMEQTRTPEHEPVKRRPAGITQAQKQVLMDNLQQEVTDRARRLRTQYAQQAQNLRTRLEMRINRIPTGLRKRKMQDLIDEQSWKNAPQPAAPIPIAITKPSGHEVEQSVNKSLKRQSDQISTTAEDEQIEESDLPNPKKRAKTAANSTSTANSKAARTVGRKEVPTVLSPTSHNARTLPKASIKGTDKAATNTTRPASPVKSQQTAPVKSSRTQAASKRNAQNDNESGRSSDASNTSATTTIVRKAAKGSRAATGTGAKKAAGAAARAAGTIKKIAAAATKKENVPPANAAGGRSLRKRA